MLVTFPGQWPGEYRAFMEQDTSNKKLSQADIDAVIANYSSGNSTSVDEARPPPPESPAGTSKSRWMEDPVAVFDSMLSSVAKMVPRVEQLEQSVEGVEQLRKAMIDIAAAVREMKQGMREMEKRLQAVAQRVATGGQSHQSAQNPRARQSFVCDHCKARGLMASRVKCTRCGKENWWGWWG